MTAVDHRDRKNGGGGLRRGVIVVLAIVVLALIGMTWIGIPGLLTERLLASVNSGDWFCDVSRLTLDLRGGIVAHHLRVYQKGFAGPPCIEADRVGVRFFLFERMRKGQSRIREVTVIHGVVRSFRRAEERRGAGNGKSGKESEGGGAGATVESMLRLEGVDLMGVAVRRARARVTMDSGVIAFSGMDVVVGDDLHSGTIRGEVARDKNGDVRGHLVTRVDPRAVQPFLSEMGWNLSAVLDRFSFHSEPPALELNFVAPAGDARLSVAEGSFQASEFGYLGAAVGFANITWKHERGAGRHRLLLNPMVLVMAGRSVTGGITIDLERGWVEGEAVSTIEVPMLARIIELPQGWIPETWTFANRERLYAKGRFAYGDRALTALEVTAEGGDLQVGRFRADEVSVKCVIRGMTNDVTDIRGRIAGGSFTAAVMSMPDDVEPKQTRYTVKGEILHAELRDVLSMVNPGMATGIQGKVYGNIEFKGVVGGATTNIVGRGEVNIRQGQLFSIPLFGGLTQALMARFPGVDMFVLQREARATFDIKNGKVRSRDMRLDGDVFAIEADGDIGLDGVLGFVVKVRPVTERKVIGPALRALTFPISKLLEFTLDGTLAHPRWKSSALSWPGWFEGDTTKEKGKR